jgi:hypothetical protein
VVLIAKEKLVWNYGPLSGTLLRENKPPGEKRRPANKGYIRFWASSCQADEPNPLTW